MNLITDQLFYKVGEKSEDGYMVYNADTAQVIFVNNGLGKILEQDHDLEELDELYSYVNPDDITHLKAILNNCIQDKNSAKCTFRLLLPNQEKYLSASLNVVEFQSQNLLCCIFEDVTIEQHNRIHIEQINARKNVTLEVVSHDIKEPLGMIKMIASFVESKIGNNDREVKESLVLIQEMCERNLELIRSMVNREFLKSSVVELSKERVDLVWEVRDVVRFYKRSTLSALRDFSFSTSSEKIYVPVDTMKFLQVVNNLISNSIKYTPVGGKISVALEDREDHVLVSVSDNGIGIPAHMRYDIFNPGKQALRDGLAGEPSGGLGLGIIKKIVDLHGGRVYFASEEGQGTSFFIELPKE